jgi:ATP-dependent RNA helicase DeaD
VESNPRRRSDGTRSRSGGGRSGGRSGRSGRGQASQHQFSGISDQGGHGLYRSGEQEPGGLGSDRDHRAARAVSPPAGPVEGPAFRELGLSETTLAAVERAGYSTATPVQAGLIPKAIRGGDVLGQARTGTGKTASFVIPILERLSAGPGRGTGPRALVLVPTRELAVQVRDEFEKLAHGSGHHCVAVYGGKPIKGQIDKLARRPAVIVGTPGRVLDHMSRGTLALGDLEVVTLDEADRMLDIGFRPDIEKILRRCPDSRQTLLLSATVPPPVRKIAERYMRNPESLDFSSTDIAVETIEQFYFTVDPRRKFDLLERLLERERPRQAIVFCRTKRGTDKVFERLSRRSGNVGDVACIHGDLSQSVRDRVMRMFREGAVRVLVATDVVGRGIDVSSVSHIVNYDIPEFCDDYVHRVGRTGRMGREGVAFTFVSPEEGPQLTRIEIRIDKLLTRDEIPGFAAMETPAPVRTPQTGADAAVPGESDTAEPPPPPPKPAGPPLLGKGRAPKRFRRAL